MIDELLLQRMCKQYNIKYQVIETTNIILLYTGIDDWMIKYIPGRDKPYCLMHKNKLKQTKKFHVQGYRRTLFQSLDSVTTHKKVLSSIYGGSSPIHKQKNNNINESNKYNKKGKSYC